MNKNKFYQIQEWEIIELIQVLIHILILSYLNRPGIEITDVLNLKQAFDALDDKKIGFIYLDKVRKNLPNHLDTNPSSKNKKEPWQRIQEDRIDPFSKIFQNDSKKYLSKT